MEILGLAAFQGRRRERCTVRMARARLSRGRLSACSSHHCGTYRVNEADYQNHITHLWLIIVDPTTYLCHSTTMETPHMELACFWIFTHDVNLKWHLHESMSLCAGADVCVCVCVCVRVLIGMDGCTRWTACLFPNCQFHG